ncbi:MAG: acyltransferase family protein [Gemmatimonadota bacterium]|nr:acyltransferase family protein [Gemmatimonadota bacterium]
MTFREDIHGLRGIAILLVVAYHVHSRTFSGGFVGVDIFFVLSGFLITGILLRESAASGRINLLEFYARRARRLLPASAAVFLATVAVAAIVLSPLEQLTLSSAGVTTALYVSNLFFLRESTDYLASPPEGNPFLHTWSLSVEEQFYVVWPTVIWVVVATWRRPSARIGAIALLAAASFGLNVWLTGFAQPWAFFGPAARVWEFGAGALVAMWPREGRPVPPTFCDALVGLGLALIVASATWMGRDTTFPGVAAAVPVAGTVLILAFGHRSTVTSRALRLRPLQWFGDVSYVWYLWHWPVIVFADALIPDLGPAGFAATGLASLALSAATRRVLEDTVRFSPALSPKPALTLALALLVTATDTGAAALWRVDARRASTTPEQLRFSAARDDNPVLYADGCHLDYEHVTSPDCTFGEADSTDTIVLFGDSHAAHWFPALARVAATSHRRLLSLTKSGCPSADVAIRDLRIGRRYTECEAWRQGAMARIIAARPRFVVVTNASDYVAPGAVDATDVALEGTPDTAADRPLARTSHDWAAGLRRTLTELTSAGIDVVLLRDSPRPGFDVPTCLARRAWRPALFGAGCHFDQASGLRPDIRLAEDRAADGLERVSLVDLSTTICGGRPCDTERGDLVLYRDHHHLTSSFSATLAPELASALARAGHE